MAFYFTVFGRLFPLVEYRQWIVTNVPFTWVLTNAFDPHSAFHRSLPIWFATWLDAACGGNIVCHNVAWLAIFCGSALMAAIAMGLISGWRYPAVAMACAALILFSEAALNALSWQATALDKLGALFCSTTLVAYLASFRLSLLLRILLGNSVILVLLVATFNCKEATWVLAPSLVWMGLLVEGKHGIARGILRTLSTLAMPLLYVLYVSVRWGWHTMQKPFDQHNFGGNIGSNLVRFLCALYNLGPAPVTAMSIVGVFMALVLVAGLVRQGGRAEFLRWSAWSSVSFLLALVPPAATEYAAVSPFYLLVPGIYLGIFHFVLVSRIIELASNVAWRTGVYALVGAAVYSHLVLFNGIFWTYAQISPMSDNFRLSLPLIAKASSDCHAPIRILYPKSNWMGYKFVESGKVGRYVYAEASELAARFDEKMQCGTFERDYHEALKPEAVNVILDDNMACVRIERPATAE
jgi:hypothetical protein